jgi:RNA polymerase sigma-70 factor (ECF subfamily)
MDDDDQLARRYEASRPRLRAMAYRMLGSLSDAEDAVQEGWMHASAAGAGGVANLEGWFTTIVARVCLDMLRSRKSRREEPLDPDEAVAAVAGDGAGSAGAALAGAGAGGAGAGGPESEAVLADSVGLALLVVLDTLPPAERVAFVLHDTFGLPFGEIAAITGRSPAAARQLASRARRRIQGSEPDAPARARLARQRRVAEAFLAASRGGDLAGLIAVLDPDVVLTSDAAAVPGGVPRTVRGAQAVARGARAAAERSRYGRVALVNGAPGLVMAPGGRLVVALAFTFSEDKITGIDVIADPGRLAGLDIAVLA